MNVPSLAYFHVMKQSGSRRLLPLVVATCATVVSCWGCGCKPNTLDDGSAPIPQSHPATGSVIVQENYPLNANLPETHPHAWRQRRVPIRPRPNLPLNSQEQKLESYVQSFHGRVRKASRRVTLDSRLNPPSASDGLLTVDLAYCRAYGRLRDMPLLDEIVVLDLSRTDVNDKDLKELARAKNLVQLDLTYSRITDHGIQELAKVPHLQLAILLHTDTTLVLLF